MQDSKVLNFKLYKRSNTVWRKPKEKQRDQWM